MNSLHQTSHVSTTVCNIWNTVTIHSLNIPCNLVSEPFTWNDGNVLTYPLIDVEVHGETSVILLDDHLGRLLYSLGSYSPLRKRTPLLVTLDAVCHPFKRDSSHSSLDKRLLTIIACTYHRPET